MKPSDSLSSIEQPAANRRGGICVGRMTLLRFMLAALLAMFCSSGAVAVAQPQSADVPEEMAEETGAGLNQRQALERVRARFPGNIISINEVRQGDRVRFRIRLDNEGNIYTVYVDRATGAISRE